MSCCLVWAVAPLGAGQLQDMARLVLVGVGLCFLVVYCFPAQGCHSLEDAVEVLQHFDKFMADQQAADLNAHPSLLQVGYVMEPSYPVVGVLTWEFGRTKIT